VQDIVRAIRNMRAEKNVTPGKRIGATIVSADKLTFIQQELPVIAALAHLDLKQVEVLEYLETKPEGQVALVVAGVEMYFPLAEMVDLEAEHARLEKELAAIQGEITRLETLLASSFGQKAPPAVVDKERTEAGSIPQYCLEDQPAAGQVGKHKARGRRHDGATPGILDSPDVTSFIMVKYPARRLS